MDNNAINWDKEYDVIIIGSGFAGTSAACAIADNDLGRVVILEKMRQLGGNSCITSGWLSVPGCKEQLAVGVYDDSPELFLQDIIKYGDGLADETLARILAYNAKNAYDYLLSKGALFLEKATMLAGHSKARSPIPAAGVGFGLLMPLQRYARKNGSEFKERCFARKIILDDSGKAIGVVVWENYDFTGQGEDAAKIFIKPENIKYYKANKGVIVASGGFAADNGLCRILDNRVTANTEHTNHWGATSFSLYMLLRAGGKPQNLSCVQWGPWCSPDECGYGTAPDLCDFMKLYGIALDPVTGRRLFNEHADRTTLTDVLLKNINRPDGPIYPVLICGEILEKESPAIYINKAIRSGVAHKFNSLRSLAKFYGIPEKELKNTIKKYNAFVEAEEDPDFGKDFKRIHGTALTKGPFYAMRMAPKIHYTTGGIKINEYAQVINGKTGEPIECLYAAGEITGGLHGRTRLGGNSIMEALVFGYLAGLHAAGGIIKEGNFFKI